MKSYPLCIFILLLATTSAYAKAWRGIEPLHSTRADVERLIGPPNFHTPAGVQGYDYPEERAFITYSSKGCEQGLPGGWNVPKDTVIEIQVYLTNSPKWSEISISGREYRQIQTVHTPGLNYYVDAEEGVTFSVSDGVVSSLTYGPAAKDKVMSCGEYKYAAPVLPGAKLKSVEHYPLDEFGNVRYEDAQARLDNFVIQLFTLNEQEPVWRGYIVVYAARRSRIGWAQFKANCYKNYLVRVRQMNPANLFAVDGGYREDSQVQLYLGRTDYYPPVLMPTVSPKKVQLIKRRLRSCNE